MAVQRNRKRFRQWLGRLINIRRELVSYFNWHTGQQPNNPVKFITRFRKIKQKAGFELRKIARFVTWHTGTAVIPSNPVQNVVLRTRRSKKLVIPAGRHKANFNKVWNTGQFTVSPVNIFFRTRQREKLVISARSHMAHFYINYHTGLAPIPATFNWLGVSLRSNTKRGGY